MTERQEEEEALGFLTRYMPPRDRETLRIDYLVSNVKLALQVFDDRQ